MVLAAACQHQPADPSARPAATTVEKVWLLEASGPPVADTAVTFAARTGRTVVVRHAAPDNMIFVTLRFPASKDSTVTADSIHVQIDPTPGKYGFALTTSDKLPVGTTATFSYAIHFQMPGDALVKYPSPGRFEQLVAPALMTADNRVQFLVGERPAADLLSFLVTGAGSYLLAVAK